MVSILLWFVTHSVIKFLRKRNNEKERKKKKSHVAHRTLVRSLVKLTAFKLSVKHQAE